jgi:hypothetical protein
MPRSITEAGAFHHHRDQVLADVVDVALDGADHHLADGFDARFGEERPQDFHPAFHRIGGKQHFGHEQDAVAEVDTDDAHSLDQRVVQHLLGSPPARQEDVRGLHDLLAEPVVEVVVDLQHEILVVEAAEIQFVFDVVGHPCLQSFDGASSGGGGSARMVAGAPRRC